MQEFHSQAEKEAFVTKIFDRIASRYEFMNTILSFNQDKYWRSIAVENLALRREDKLLDVAAGTCNLTIEALKKEPSLEVTALDFNRSMLEVGRKNLEKKGLLAQVTLQAGDAMHLPYEDSTFNCAICGFALRNVPDVKQVLEEMKRVVKKGGTVVTLELAKPSIVGFKEIYYLYFERLLPFLGSLGITGETYSWLPESLRRYPHQEKILELFRTVGFHDASYQELTGGIVAVHRGIVS